MSSPQDNYELKRHQNVDNDFIKRYLERVNSGSSRDIRRVKEWFTIIGAKQATKISYIQAFAQFLEYTKMTPDELIKEADNEISEGVQATRRKIKLRILDYREHIQERGLAPKTVNKHISAIISFYKSAEIDIPQINHRKSKVLPLLKNKKFPTKKEILEVLRYADIRDLAIILVQSTSGLSVNELVTLRVGDINRGYDKETGVTTLRMRRQKVDFDFVTFLSPEASKAVLDYIEYRNRKPFTNEKRRQMEYEKRKINSDNDFLFIKKVIPDGYLETQDEKLRRLGRPGVMQVYKRLGKKAGMDTPKGDWGFIRSHNMRKYFNTSLLNGGLDIFSVDYFMGHTMDDTHSAYFSPDPEKLKLKYLRHLPYLEVSDTETKVIETAEYKELREEKERLNQKVGKLELDLEKFSRLLERDSTNLKNEAIAKLFEDDETMKLFISKLLQYEGDPQKIQGFLSGVGKK
ncbi:TPA: tyrosine-type recombinase/integrase [Methanosarcinaceae archaeon]|nr:tyrosine-type recombinase/integrase [Methanosarcinaceae archaeon]